MLIEQIAGLEREVGVRLFRRVPRGVAPTPAGTVAVDLARGVLARVDAVAPKTSDWRSGSYPRSDEPIRWL